MPCGFQLLRGHTQAKVFVKPSGLYVAASMARDPDRGEGPNVHPPASSDELAQRIAAVQELLESRGIIVDLQACDLSRVDLFKDLPWNGSWEALAVGLQTRSFQRMSPGDLGSISPLSKHGRLARSKGVAEHSYGTSSLGEWGAMVYSKSSQLMKQVKHRDLAQKALSGGTRAVLRAEVRLMKKRQAEAKLGIRTVSELIGMWEELPDRYASIMSDLLKAPEALPNPPLKSLMDIIVQRHGHGAKAVLMDMASQGFARLVEGGAPDAIDERMAMYQTAGIRTAVARGVMDKLGDLVPVGDLTSNQALSALARLVHGEPFAWPQT